ncbi:hypothetical protein MMC07_006898 [Pseudocyphellaria aurata]|nr:hypothetical protein [Pseudocyphellaria aurata]
MNQTLLAEEPALPPPPGLHSNFDNPSSLDRLFVGALILMLSLVSLAVVARLVAKIYIMKSMQSEDYLSVAAWLGFIPWMALSFVLCKFGGGRHQWDISVLDGFQILRFANIMEIMYSLIICAAKVSILVQFLRILVPKHQGLTYRTIHFVIWTNVLFYVAICLSLIFQCTPREKIWHPYIPGRCINLDVQIVTSGAWNVISDISIFILPLHCIWHLHIPIKRKFGVSAVFAAGLFACIASVCRLVYSVENLLTLDKLYTFQQFGMWGVAEVTTLILCGCLPVLPRLRQIFQRRPSYASSSTQGRRRTFTDRDRSKNCNSNPSNPNPSQISTSTWVESTYVPLAGLSAATISSSRGGADERGATDEVEIGQYGGITKTVLIETQLHDSLC